MSLLFFFFFKFFNRHLNIAGISGSTPLAIGGGSVGDLFSERDRVGAMALYTLGPLFGMGFSDVIPPSLNNRH